MSRFLLCLLLLNAAQTASAWDKGTNGNDENRDNDKTWLATTSASSIDEIRVTSRKVIQEKHGVKPPPQPVTAGYFLVTNPEVTINENVSKLFVNTTSDGLHNSIGENNANVSEQRTPVCPRRRMYQSLHSYIMQCTLYGLPITTFQADPMDLMPGIARNASEDQKSIQATYPPVNWWNSRPGNSSKTSMFDLRRKQYDEELRNKSRIIALKKKKQMYYYTIAGRLWKYSSPVIIALGTVGNALSILVMVRKAFRHTTMCFYLITLAIADTFVLYGSLLPRSLSAYLTTPLELQSDFLCKSKTFLIYFVSHVASWILVCLTTERFVAVMFPHYSRMCFTKTRAALSLAFIVLVLFSIDLHFFWTHHLQEHRLQYVDLQTMTLRTRITVVCSISLHVKQHYNLMAYTWPWIDMALFSLIPFVFIITGNVSICVKLVLNHRQRRAMVSTNQSLNQAKLTATTIVLGLVSMLFVVSTLPVTVWQFFALNVGDDDDTWARLQIIRAAVGILQYFNNAFNFILYCLTGRQFRKELCSILKFRKRNYVLPIVRSDNNGTAGSSASQPTTESNV